MRSRTLPLCFIGVAGLTLAACIDNAPTAAATAPVSTAVHATLSGPVGFVTAQTEDELKPLLEVEKARIAAELANSQRVYDSLKVVWDEYLLNPQAFTSRLIMCDPLQYAAEAKIIGPEGGDIAIGPHKLTIPKGALSSYVVITGEMPVSLLVSAKLWPHGLTFLKAPRLTLSYKHCNRSPGFTERVAYIDDAQQILEWPRSKDSSDGLVDAWIWHFSSYVVAY